MVGRRVVMVDWSQRDTESVKGEGGMVVRLGDCLKLGCGGKFGVACGGGMSRGGRDG